MVTQLPIKCQTAVHVMSLIVGGLGAGDEAMARYLEQRGMLERLRVVYPRGEPVDLLVPAVRTVVWSPDESRLELSRGNSGFRLMGENVRQAAVTWMLDKPVQGVSLSGNELRIRYRNREADLKAVISLERPVSDGRSVSQEIFVNLRHTRWLTQELCIPLPATPGLSGIKKVTLLLGCKEGRQRVDLKLSAFKSILLSE